MMAMATITMGRWLMATMMAAFEQRAARPQKKEGGEKEVLVGWNVAHHPHGHSDPFNSATSSQTDKYLS
jgi:hypothetical protein